MRQKPSLAAYLLGLFEQKAPKEQVIDQPVKPKLRRPSQRNFSAMVRRRQRELHRLTDKLAKGEITADEWADRFDAVLLEGHTQAQVLGRRLAGDATAESLNDLLVAITAKDREAQYLARFLRDIKDGLLNDVQGKLKANKVKNRQNLYLGRMRGTANKAFVTHTPTDLDWFAWRLGGRENHCSICPTLAAQSPWSKDTLWTFPGEGDTPCLGHCKCFLQRVDGRMGFRSHGGGGGGGGNKPPTANDPDDDSFFIPGEINVPREKLTDYLLNPNHERGKHKYRVLRSVGFTEDDPDALEAAVRKAVKENPARPGLVDEHGVRYTVRAEIVGPNGGIVKVKIGLIKKPNKVKFQLTTVAPG